jgi:hypothetical protein
MIAEVKRIQSTIQARSSGMPRMKGVAWFRKKLQSASYTPDGYLARLGYSEIPADQTCPGAALIIGRPGQSLD